MNIRNATDQDQISIDRIYVSAFPEGEGEIVSKIALGLLSESTKSAIISLVAEVDGNVVGHVAFSPIKIEHNLKCLAYILTPLAVLPEYQKQSIGSKLVESGIKKLSDIGLNYIFVYGDPKYYGRFGFFANVAESFKVPYKLEFPFGWLGLVLTPCEISQAPATIHCVSTLSDPEIW